MQAVPESMCRLLDWILSSRGSMSKMEPGSVRQTLRSFTKRKKSTNQEWIKKVSTKESQEKIMKGTYVKREHVISKHTAMQTSKENKKNFHSAEFVKKTSGWNVSCPVCLHCLPPAHMHTRQLCASPHIPELRSLMLSTHWNRYNVEWKLLIKDIWLILYVTERFLSEKTKPKILSL